MFDTGNQQNDGAQHLLPRLTADVQPEFSEDEWAPMAIQRVGVRPEDIDFIIMSHLHHDHAGAIEEFPNATVIVRRAEYDYVRRPDYFMTRVYYNDEVPAPVTNFDFQGTDGKDIAIDWYFLEDEKTFDLFGDGRIVIYNTPGHSIGHQSLLVRTEENGDFMLCADAAYFRENIDQELLPGLVYSPHDYLQSIKTIRLLEKTGVTIVTGHDPIEWEQFKHAPAFYN